VFRTVLETTRTLFVWLADLLLFYTPLGVGKLGESWSRHSYVQAVGCAAAPHAASPSATVPPCLPSGTPSCPAGVLFGAAKACQ